MVKGLYTAATGMVNEQRRVDILSNNLANSATTGYKKEGSTSQAFSDVLAYKIKDSSEAYIPRKLGYMNMGVKIGETYTDYSQGSFHETGNRFEMALSGPGFFTVEFTNKNGETSLMYTRDGTFTNNANNYLVNKNGDYLLDDKGNHICVDPFADIKIDRTGRITQDGVYLTTVGVADFTDYDYLKKYGENYYEALEGAELQASTAEVYEGYLESSNVQVVQEMVDLINFQRAYESNQKMIQAFDESLSTAVNLGKL